MTAALDTYTRESANGLSGDERLRTSEELLQQLAAIKAEHPHLGMNKDLLRDPEASSVVNSLVLLNEPWVRKVVKDVRRERHLKESADELMSLALVGEGSTDTDARGAIGAILSFDFDRGGIRPFLPYLEQAIRHSLTPSLKQQKNARAIDAHTHGVDPDKPPPWGESRERPVEAVPIDQELLGVLRYAITHLPKDRQRVANFIVEFVLEHGDRPTFEQVARFAGGVSRERGAQITRDTIDRIGEKIRTLYPQLAEGGVNGWDDFKAAFGRTGYEAGVGV